MPLTAGGGTVPQVHGNVKNLAFNGPDQFALSVGFLEVQAPQYAFYRTGLVVLHKMRRDTGSLKIPLRVTFKKITPAVAEYLSITIFP